MTLPKNFCSISPFENKLHGGDGNGFGGGGGGDDADADDDVYTLVIMLIPMKVTFRVFLR